MEELKQLHDIKPLVEIPDASIYLYWGLIGLATLMGAALIFMLIAKIMELRNKNTRKLYIAKLHAIDFEDAKQAAYDATHYGRLVAQSQREKEIYSQLLTHLEPYKYRKIVEPIDSDTRKKFTLFLQVIEP